MHRGNVSTYLGPLLIAAVLIAAASTRQVLHAQAPSAVGTAIPVKMIDTIDSNTGGAGKQYHALVTKAVDTGNGIVIAQGSSALVTLAGSGSNWSAQLSSVSINGQQVAVSSSSATVTSAAPTAVGSAVGTMNSVLGGFGHHVKAPAGVTAVVTGQRVLLPAGTTLTFVLSQPPASSPAITAAQPAAAQAMVEAAAPPTNPAGASAPSPAHGAAAATGHYVFCFTGQYASSPTNFHTSAVEPVTYFSEVFPEPTIGLHVNVDWNAFLQKKSMPMGACQDAIGLSVAQARKQQRVDEYRKEKKQIVETGWKYTPDGAATTNMAPAAAPTTATTEYSVQCAAIFGNRAGENCAAAANEYYVYCYSASLDGPTMYFSDVFAFNRNVSSDNLSANLAGPFLQVLEDRYGVKVSSDFYSTSHYTGGSYPTYCSASLTPLSWAQQQKQAREDNVTKNLHKQIAETGWKTTIAPLPPVTAPPAAANEFYLFCHSDKALPVQYFSEIFAAVPTGDPIRNAFFAFLQKKYGFNDPRPGPPVDCDQSPKPANAYMFKTEWSVRQNMEGGADLNKNKVIETGWKYMP